jgi:hypothetical protein
MIKMSHFRLNKVTGNCRRNGEKATIAYRRDFFDIPVVALHEFQVCHNASNRQALLQTESLSVQNR